MHDHEWEASVKSRTVNGTGCPYCSHNMILPGFNDLEALFPQVAREWSKRNLPLLPSKVTAYSNKKVWWECEHGHEWQALISTRSYGSKCPVCSGMVLLPGFNDLATTNPEVASEWSERNLPLKPEMLNAKSTKNVWWKCATCGYEWKAVVKARVNGQQCPVCAKIYDIPLTEIAKYEADITLQVALVYRGDNETANKFLEKQDAFFAGGGANE